MVHSTARISTRLVTACLGTFGFACTKHILYNGTRRLDVRAEVFRSPQSNQLPICRYVMGSDSWLAVALAVIAAKALAPCPCHRSLPIRHWGSSPRCEVQGRRFE